MNAIAADRVTPYHKGIKEIPSQEYLRACFDYVDGRLIWKRRPVEHFTSIRIANGCNTRSVGKLAEYISQPTVGPPYKVVGLNQSLFRCHRIIWKMFYGDIPSDKEIDHINGNSLDNRLENLRLVTRSQNMINRDVRKKSSLPKGVTRNRGTFLARIKKDKVEIILGYFKTKEEAANAYNEAAKKIHGEFARIAAPTVEAGAATTSFSR